MHGARGFALEEGELEKVFLIYLPNWLGYFRLWAKYSSQFETEGRYQHKLISKATVKQRTNYLQSDPSGRPLVLIVPFFIRKWRTAVGDVC
jgi:hypothetical protein